MIFYRPPEKSKILTLTEVSKVSNDLNNVGDDDDPEQFDKLVNHTQTANDLVFNISCENCYLSSERSNKALSRMCYEICKSGVRHESEETMKKIKKDMGL